MFFTILGIAYLTACTTSWAVHKLISLSEYIRKNGKKKKAKKKVNKTQTRQNHR